MTSLVGRLVDKANIIKATFSELEKAVIKATKHNLKGPKEKHVRRLVVSTFEQPSKNQEIISLLQKRLEVIDWIVVMKTLEVFHRLLRDAHNQFISDLKYKAAIFNLKQFKDVSSPEAHYQSIFIQKYSQYIEEKVLVFKMLNMEFEKDPTAVKSFSIEDSFEKIPRLQSQLNALLNTRASKNHINNPIIVYGFTLLTKDSFKLYRALNDSVISLLERYFTMNKLNASKSLEIYKLFTKETDGIIQFFDIVRKFSRSDLPELQHAPTTLVEALENYLRELDDGKGNQPQQSSERGRKLVQQFTDFRFDDSGFQEEQHNNQDSDSDDEDHHKGASHSNATAQRPSNTAQPQQQPPQLFDPFSFEAEANASADALPTFGANTSSGAFFDDPFGGPVSKPNPANQVIFDQKKKQIEAVMTSNAYGAPLQPQVVSNNTAFANQNNQLGFGNQPNNQFGFGNQPTGFGNQPNNQFGFGNQQQQQQPNNQFGFGNQPNNQFGFGNQQQPNNQFGFGNQQQSAFGNQPNNQFGFGNQQQSAFGNQPNNQFGFGAQQQQPNNQFGFGNQQQTNTNNPFFSNTTTTTNNNTGNDFNPFA